MPKRNAKGRFMKKSHHKHRRHRRHHHAAATRTVHHHHSARRGRGRRRHHSGGGVSLKHIAIAGLGLAFLTGAASPIKAIPDNVAKLPGAKTFGNPAIAGIACLAADRFVHRNKWLRAAGLVGVVLGAVQVGTKGKDFAWVGDPAHELAEPDDVVDMDEGYDE